jgi:hypothetical protein
VAHHRDKPGDEDGLAAVAQEEFLGPLQMVHIEEQVAAVAQHHRFPQPPHAVGQQRSDDGARVLATNTGTTLNSPVKIRKPAKGMTSSLGMGATMLSRVISRKTPT